jgi:hypothetical protein
MVLGYFDAIADLQRFNHRFESSLASGPLELACSGRALLSLQDTFSGLEYQKFLDISIV